MRGLTNRFDGAISIFFAERDQRVRRAHLRPCEVDHRANARRAFSPTCARALLRFLLQRVDVAERVDRFAYGVVVRIRRASAGLLPRMHFDQLRREINSHRLRIEAHAHALAEIHRRHRVERARDLNVMIGMHLRFGKRRHVEGCSRRCEHRGFLDEQILVAWHLARRAVDARAGDVAAPRRRAPSPICERLACGLARKPTVARVRDVALDLRLVARLLHARRVDEDAACLRVFCKYLIEPRRRRVRAHDHRARVVRHERLRHPVEKLPRRFQPFDYCVRRLRKRRPYEAVATRPERHDQDPQSALLPVDLHATHLREIDLRLLSCRRIDEPHCRLLLAPAELLHRVAPQRCVRHVADAASHEQRVHPRKTQVLYNPFFDLRAMLLHVSPRVARLRQRARLHALRNLVHDGVRQHRSLIDSDLLRHLDVAAHRLAIDARPARYRLDALLGLPASQHFSHVSHGQLPVHAILPDGVPRHRRRGPCITSPVARWGPFSLKNWGSLEPENPNHTPACGGPLCLQIVGSHEPENFPLMRSHHAAKRQRQRRREPSVGATMTTAYAKLFFGRSPHLSELSIEPTALRDHEKRNALHRA